MSSILYHRCEDILRIKSRGSLSRNVRLCMSMNTVESEYSNFVIEYLDEMERTSKLLNPVCHCGNWRVRPPRKTDPEITPKKTYKHNRINNM